MRLQTRWQLRLQLSESLTGAECFASKRAHSHELKVGAGCWQEASVLLHMGLSMRYLSNSTACQQASTRVGDP